MKQMPISKLNDRLNGDMTLRRYERSDAGVRLPGRNDIRENGEPLLTLSLLRAHFYTGVFHTSYVRSARLTADNCVVTSVLRHSVPNKGLHPLRYFAAIPASL